MKFRIWSVCDNKFCDIEWFFMRPDGTLIKVDIFMGRNEECGSYEADMSKADENFIVNYSIGLIDKNGVEIFEGDILKNTSEDYARNVTEYIVKIEVGQKREFGFGCCSDIYGINTHLGIDQEEEAREIIGNIYENPELFWYTNDALTQKAFA